MIESTIRTVIVVGAGVLWVAGLRLFLLSDLPRRKKVGWSGVLVIAGAVIGVLLSSSQLWSKFVVLVLILPLLALLDVCLLRMRRGLMFWIRACGFEVCTVFGAAAGTRCLLNLLGVAPALVVRK